MNAKNMYNYIASKDLAYYEFCSDSHRDYPNIGIEIYNFAHGNNTCDILKVYYKVYNKALKDNVCEYHERRIHKENGRYYFLATYPCLFKDNGTKKVYLDKCLVNSECSPRIMPIFYNDIPVPYPWPIPDNSCLDSRLYNKYDVRVRV